MQIEATVDRVERLCSGELDARTLREAVLAELRPVLPFDAHVWALTDPETLVATSPHADVPFLPWPRLPALIRWRYLTRVNRWDSLIGTHTTVARLHESTKGDLSLSSTWRQVLGDYGVVDIATVVFADRFGCWAFLDLLRTSPSGPFTDAERDLLVRIEPVLTRGLRATQSRAFTPDEDAFELDGPAVVLLDDDLTVLTQTTTAGAALMQLNPPGTDMAPIPAAVYNLAGALVALESQVSIGSPRSRVHLGSGRWVTLRAERLGATRGDDDGRDSGGPPGGIAVTIEPSTPAERLDVYGRACGLSPRERDVLGEIVAGSDNRTMARTLGLSQHTIHDHVKAVLAKCDVASRQLLISRVAGTR